MPPTLHWFSWNESWVYRRCFQRTRCELVCEVWVCTPCRLQPKSYQYLLAFIFATEDVNRNPHLLPNVSLGFDLYNAIHSEWKTLESTLTWLSAVGKAIPNYTCVRKSKSVAAITGNTGAISAQIGTLLELYKFPQVSGEKYLSSSGAFLGGFKSIRSEWIYVFS